MSKKKSVRRSLSMTPDMRDHLAQLVSKQPRNITKPISFVRQSGSIWMNRKTSLVVANISRNPCVNVLINWKQHWHFISMY